MIWVVAALLGALVGLVIASLCRTAGSADERAGYDDRDEAGA